MKNIPVPKWKLGDSVRAKKGVYHSEFGDVCIEGWQGRVVNGMCTYCNTSDDCDEECVMVEFDSITLQNMPSAFLKRCIKEGKRFTKDSIYCKEVERAYPRDTVYAVQKARKKLRERYPAPEKQAPANDIFGGILQKRGFSARVMKDVFDFINNIMDKLPQKSRNDIKRIGKEIVDILMKELDEKPPKALRKANTRSLAKSKIKRSKDNLN